MNRREKESLLCRKRAPQQSRLTFWYALILLLGVVGWAATGNKLFIQASAGLSLVLLLTITGAWAWIDSAEL